MRIVGSSAVYVSPALPDSVRAKRDGQGGGGRQPGQQNKDQQNQDKKDDAGAPADVGQVRAAVEGFERELAAAAQGLQASVTGHGPGLKVVLKDGTGGVVRQFSGEEFLKLREAASSCGEARRGKLLDQKG